MKLTRRLRQLVQMLPPKQQTLDFGHHTPWPQLSATDRDACRDAIAALLHQVVAVTPANNELPCKENDEHEHQRQD